MTAEWIRFGAAAGLLILGLVFEVMAVFGVNRFQKALNRMHAAAMGDTLGILFVIMGLMVMRGWSMDSLKLFLVIGFFWIASPVSGHMISRLEMMTDDNLGEMTLILKRKKKKTGVRQETGSRAREFAGKEDGRTAKGGHEK
ncbi:sodium:proton antiporter [Clostridiaceae bacterium]|nr:sodium:proton antiporter [Clostridiaceae bacterium]